MPQLLLPRGRCYYPCALLYTPDAHRLRHGRHVCQRAHVARVDYPMDDTCANVHVRHATTDRNTRALPTRGHARPRVHLTDCRITNLCARRSLCCSTRARSLHVGTPAHVCTVYGRPVRNLRARAGRYTTMHMCSMIVSTNYAPSQHFRVIDKESCMWIIVRRTRR